MTRPSTDTLIVSVKFEKPFENVQRAEQAAERLEKQLRYELVGSGWIGLGGDIESVIVHTGETT